MQGACGHEVASVAERCDDETGAVAQVLAVEELGVDGADVKVVVEPVVSSFRILFI